MKIEGLRTLISFFVSVLALTGGLALLAADQRGAAYGAFSLALVGLFTGQVGKSSIGVLAQGTGVKGAVSALMTDQKPGEPPKEPQP